MLYKNITNSLYIQKKLSFYIWNLKIMLYHINLIKKSSKNKIHCYPGDETNIDYPNQTIISIQKLNKGKTNHLNITQEFMKDVKMYIFYEM